MKKFLSLLVIFVSLLTLVACSAAPPNKLSNSPAGVLMGDSIATWNDDTITPASFFDALSGADKKWVKEKEGVWYIQEQRNGKIIKHYFAQNGSSTHMVYAKINVDGQDRKPFAPEPQSFVAEPSVPATPSPALTPATTGDTTDPFKAVKEMQAKESPLPMSKTLNQKQ